MMHSMRRAGLAIAALCALGACEMAPAMTADEARRVLRAYATGTNGADICSDEGRSQFRAATRAYSAAMAAEGKEWPDLYGVGEGGGAMTNDSAVDIVVAGAIVGGFVEPSDLHGEARTVARLLSTVSVFAGDLRRAVKDACPELFALQQAQAELAIDQQRQQRSLARATERGDSDRVRQLAERYAESNERAYRRITRLTEDVQERLVELGVTAP